VRGKACGTLSVVGTRHRGNRCIFFVNGAFQSADSKLHLIQATQSGSLYL